MSNDPSNFYARLASAIKSEENKFRKPIDAIKKFHVPIIYQISSCRYCPFYSHKYCLLSQSLNESKGTDFSTFVKNEWKAKIIPLKCPLKNADFTFTLNEQPK